MNKEIGIYVHIPFCASKCYYCDFVSYCDTESKYIERYINAVCMEILENAEILSQYNIKTIYFGGGTPSYIDSKYIKQIMDTLRLFFNDVGNNIDNLREITIEINPNSLSENKISEYVSLAINRISIGLQTTHDSILSKIGRKHNFDEFKNALYLCRQANIKNISVDLMYPLPSLTLEMFEESLNTLMKLKDEFNIKHISVYNLELHEGAKLDFLVKEGYETLAQEDEEMSMKRVLEKILDKNGYLNYEISNFATCGYESKHNLNYWNQGEYLGFGVNASSFFAGTRYTNCSELDKYIDCIENNTSCVSQKDELNKLDLMKEYVILKLRLHDGFNIDEFKSRFKINIYDLFKKELDELINLKLLCYSNSNIKLTKRGRDLANIVWQKFI